jgi:hypothetical protein
MPECEQPDAAEIARYIETFKTSILVRLKVGCEWRDMTIAKLREHDAAEAARVEARLIDRGYFPHRVVVV